MAGISTIFGAGVAAGRVGAGVSWIFSGAASALTVVVAGGGVLMTEVAVGAAVGVGVDEFPAGAVAVATDVGAEAEGR